MHTYGITAAVWGLDADLIILGLASGLPNLYLFREHVPEKGEDDNTLATRDWSLTCSALILSATLSNRRHVSPPALTMTVSEFSKITQP